MTTGQPPDMVAFENELKDSLGKGETKMKNTFAVLTGAVLTVH